MKKGIFLNKTNVLNRSMNEVVGIGRRLLVKKIVRLKALIILLFVLLLFACSQNDKSDVGGYESAEAIERGDVVITSDGLSNFDRFEDFLDHISKKKEDYIRITSYTIEGDPIFQDLHYDGKVIQYKHDHTHDEYGEKKVDTDDCKKILKKINDGGKTEYYATSCEKNGPILLLEK